MKEVLIKNEKELTGLAGELLRVAGEEKNINLILFKGELGAGKTTLIQNILAKLGAEGPFTSPTFVIMKAYRPSSKSKVQSSKLQSKTQRLEDRICRIFHLDVYRVGAEDVLELGWEEIIGNRQNLVLVEWPERISEILPENYLEVSIEIVSENKRRFSIIFKSKQNDRN